MITFIFAIITLIAGGIGLDYVGGENTKQIYLILGIALCIDIYAYLFIRSYVIVGEEEKVAPLYCAGKGVLLAATTVGMVIIPLGVLSIFSGNYEGIFWTLLLGPAVVIPAGAIAFITGLIFGTIHRK